MECQMLLAWTSACGDSYQGDIWKAETKEHCDIPPAISLTKVQCLRVIITS